jgi:ADP-dependent NAD(P)H-hydrate dehydratase / NAD(P)H-hydrate epimerase
MSLSSAHALSDPGRRSRSPQLQQFVVTAEQMRQIEARLFAAGMPVAALMEKVAGLISDRVQAKFPLLQFPRVGVLVGPGHNGGDALVVARELHLAGYEVMLYQPFEQLKDLTASHARYAASLGIPVHERIEPLADCDWLIDGLFGFGLTRSLDGTIATAVDQINRWRQPIVSIDLPSGLHTDTGAVLGTAIQATHTLCLGLWKRACLQEQALLYVGDVELVDFGLPLADITAVLGPTPCLQRITPAMAIASLPLPRAATTHKYKQGHLLLVCGSRQYMGAAVLAGLAARASGVGMLSIAVPESLRLLLIAQLPDALILGCAEDESGAIAQLPDGLDLDKYDAIACGCGLTLAASSVVDQLLSSDRPLLLDADGLNSLAKLGTQPRLQSRAAATILTPHWGEFKRLFPDATEDIDRLTAVQTAAEQTGAIVLLKGARTAIASPDGTLWLNPNSTPALARGGTGDVLTGLMGGLFAQGLKHGTRLEQIVVSAAWWHAQAGIAAAQARSELGVDASTLIHHLLPALQRFLERQGAEG